MPAVKKNTLTINNALGEIIKNYFAMHEGQDPAPGLYCRVIEEVEKVLIEQTLKHTANNKLRASTILGINRNTFSKKLKKQNNVI